MSKQQYYYVMCQRGNSIHRCYVQLDPGSADILHDSLYTRYDLVQVCAVARDQVDWDLAISTAPRCTSDQKFLRRKKNAGRHTAW